MIKAVANGLRTDHPVPGLPFINDERLPLDNPDAIERTGRNPGAGLRGRTDPLSVGGWVAFTTEPKNPAYAWAVHHHPEHGRTVLLIHNGDRSDLHHEWAYGNSGFLDRHGGYWWDGTAWHRPGQVVDRAFERYDARLVHDALTVTAADLLAHPINPGDASIAKIADFAAAAVPLRAWCDHLALWAQQRHQLPHARSLDQCVIDLRAPELEPANLVDRTGLAKIAQLAPDELPHPKHGRRDLPPPQAGTAENPLWSEPVAGDWAEQYRSTHGPAILLSNTTSFGITQPRGLVSDHNRMTEIIRHGLEYEGDMSTKWRSARKDDPYDAAATLAWWPAVALTDNPASLFPVSALRTTLIEAVLGSLADDVDRARKWGKEKPSLGDIRTDVVKLLDWYIERKPGHTAGLLGEILLIARTRLDLPPQKVASLLRRSLHLDSAMDGDTVDALLEMALPPSAKSPKDR
ncbi:hypothetical protein [Streptomyces sp. NPDC088748]|uniref:hypothetical protein n=1 Tax=Streptomyces sp. NPDC088748 TaxID=3365887 RepID=UPI003809EA8F